MGKCSPIGEAAGGAGMGKCSLIGEASGGAGMGKCSTTGRQQGAQEWASAPQLGAALQRAPLGAALERAPQGASAPQSGRPPRVLLAHSHMRRKHSHVGDILPSHQTMQPLSPLLGTWLCTGLLIA